MIFSNYIQAQKNVELEFLKGEWISDSIKTSESERWRDFIFIDSLGQFYRTSWWNDTYIIDNKLLVQKNEIKKNGEKYLTIKRIDSNSIELTGKNYYGLFKRDPWPNIGTFKESLNQFIIGDSIKSKLIGSWTLKNIETTQTDNNANYPKEYLDSYKNRPFLSQPTKKEINLKFGSYNEFEISGENQTIEYRYIVDSEKISLSKSDYIITLNYNFKNKTLIIIETRHGIERRLNFIKSFQ